MRTVWMRLLAFLALSVLVLGAAFVSSQREGARAEMSVQRVVASPLPTPTPPPPGHPDCEGLVNPGGRLRWQPTASAGPWPTGGQVTLPSLGMNGAPIVRVGVGSDSKMVVPKSAHEIAWLDQGPFPGDTNNAVLAGHVNWARKPGSFVNLKDLQPGDPVVVTLDARRWEFQVAWVCWFDPDEPAADQIMGYTDVQSVTLITCGGVFDRSRGTHNKRVVARAELVSVSDV